MAAARFKVWRFVAAPALEAAACLTETLARGSLTVTVIATSAVEPTMVALGVDTGAAASIVSATGRSRSDRPFAGPRPS